MSAWTRVRGGGAPPEAELELDRAVPAAVVHAGTVLLVAAMLLVGWSTARPLGAAAVLVALVLGAVVVLLPRAALAGGALVLVGVEVLVGSPSVPQVLALVLLVHAAVWACSLAARVPRRARVEVGVLVDGAREALPVQVGAQVLALVALLLGGADVVAGDVWRVVGLAAVAGAVLLVLPRLD
ncbi:hypothetical protein KIN34_04895 [Cellulomonas sp. DKR-3]|uniref:Uncharacterized protein n=1 Tax=Cellulomonas fulva TaxID=2835530 RepID=A0ABS5TWZ8_9CELL|nr:hypothetical protein [Cellulomonas fulva]MBT0993622.1 hypothetical protein [Cellulomonas fulva]